MAVPILRPVGGTLAENKVLLRGLRLSSIVFRGVAESNGHINSGPGLQRKTERKPVRYHGCKRCHGR